MRPVQTELGHIQTWFRRLALARPRVRLVLRHGRRQLLDYQATSDRTQRVAAVLGRQVYEHLYRIDWKDEGIEISGLVSDPYETRSDSQAVHFIVNGRWVKDRVLLQAAAEASRAVLPPGRWPVAVIWLELAPAEMDVNVHPQKVEVRFRSPLTVRKALVQALTRLWAAAPWLPGTKSYVLGENSSGRAAVKTSPQAAERGPVRPPVRLSEERRALRTGHRPGTARPATAHALWQPATTATGCDAVSPQAADVAVERLPLHMWNLVGQLWNTYILLSDGDTLVVIDQHAAAERIAFQRLLEQCERGSVQSQRLLHPVLVDVEPEHAATFERWKDKLDELGFDVEQFGPATLKLAAVPAVLGTAAPDVLLRDTLGELACGQDAVSWERARNEVLSTMACHGSVRAGQRLGERQIRALVEQLEAIDFAGTCPHGRPVLVTFGKDQVGSWFGRT